MGLDFVVMGLFPQVAALFLPTSGVPGLRNSEFAPNSEFLLKSLRNHSENSEFLDGQLSQTNAHKMFFEWAKNLNYFRGYSIL